jgi:hypothetical protein
MSRTKIAQYYYNLGRQKAAQDMLGGRTKTAAKISPAMLKRLGIGAGVGAGVGGGAYGINKLLAAKALDREAMVNAFGKSRDKLFTGSHLSGIEDAIPISEAEQFAEALGQAIKARRDQYGINIPSTELSTGGLKLAPYSHNVNLKKMDSADFGFNPFAQLKLDTADAESALRAYGDNKDILRSMAALAEETDKVRANVPNMIEMLGSSGSAQVSKAISSAARDGKISLRTADMLDKIVKDYGAMEPAAGSLLKAKGAVGDALSPYFGSISSPFFPNPEVASRMAKTKAMNEFSDMGIGFDALKGLFVDQAAKNTENLGMLNKFIGNNPVYGAGMTIL